MPVSNVAVRSGLSSMLPGWPNVAACCPLNEFIAIVRSLANGARELAGHAVRGTQAQVGQHVLGEHARRSHGSSPSACTRPTFGYICAPVFWPNAVFLSARRPSPRCSARAG